MFAFLLLAAPSLLATNMVPQEPAGYTSRIDGTSFDYVRDTTTDSSGNVYVAGVSNSAEIGIDVFRDRADDSTGRPGVSTQSTLLRGGTSTFRWGYVIKYDRDGVLIWKRAFGNNFYADATGVEVDASGNVFVSGSITDSTIFGGLTVTPQVRSNVNFDNASATVGAGVTAFIGMLDRDGVWQWVRPFEYAVYPSTNANVANLGTEPPVITVGSLIAAPLLIPSERGRTFVRDANGNLYLSMFLETYSMNASASANRVMWLRTRGSKGRVALASVNNSAAVSPYTGTHFVAKLAVTPPPVGSPAGSVTTYDWDWIGPVNSGVLYAADTGAITSISTAATAAAVTGLAVDDDNSLYLTGSWSGNLVAGGIARAPFTSRDGYVARWRATDGAPLYLATYSSETAGGGASVGEALLLDEQHNVFLTGYCSNTAQVRRVSADSSISTGTLNAGAADRASSFVGKISPSGQWLWTEAPTFAGGSSYAPDATSLSRDAAGALYVGGAVTSGINATFNPGGITVAGSLTVNTVEAYVAKLTENFAGDCGCEVEGKQRCARCAAADAARAQCVAHSGAGTHHASHRRGAER